MDVGDLRCAVPVLFGATGMRFGTIEGVGRRVPDRQALGGGFHACFFFVSMVVVSLSLFTHFPLLPSTVRL